MQFSAASPRPRSPRDRRSDAAALQGWRGGRAPPVHRASRRVGGNCRPRAVHCFQPHSTAQDLGFNTRASSFLRLTKSHSGRRVLGFIGRRCGWCRSVCLVNAPQTGWIAALQIHFWTWNFQKFPLGTKEYDHQFRRRSEGTEHHGRPILWRELDGRQKYGR
jgi:hypothetical protein